MKFNEDSRVKIPSILHLTRLGFDYLPLKNATWDVDTNIFTDVFIFQTSLKQNNLPEIEEIVFKLSDQGSNLDSSVPKTDVLPITPSDNYPK